MDRDHLAEKCAATQTIKLADLIDNSASILGFDPDFAKVYMVEKRRLFEVLTKGDRSLRDVCGLILANYFGRAK